MAASRFIHECKPHCSSRSSRLFSPSGRLLFMNVLKCPTCSVIYPCLCANWLPPPPELFVNRKSPTTSVYRHLTSATLYSRCLVVNGAISNMVVSQSNKYFSHHRADQRHRKLYLTSRSDEAASAVEICNIYKVVILEMENLLLQQFHQIPAVCFHIVCNSVVCNVLTKNIMPENHYNIRLLTF